MKIIRYFQVDIGLIKDQVMSSEIIYCSQTKFHQIDMANREYRIGYSNLAIMAKTPIFSFKPLKLPNNVEKMQQLNLFRPQTLTSGSFADP